MRENGGDSALAKFVTPLWIPSSSPRDTAASRTGNCAPPCIAGAPFACEPTVSGAATWPRNGHCGSIARFTCFNIEKSSGLAAVRALVEKSNKGCSVDLGDTTLVPFMLISWVARANAPTHLAASCSLSGRRDQADWNFNVQWWNPGAPHFAEDV